MIFLDGLPFSSHAFSPSQGNEILFPLLEHPSLIRASNLLKSMPVNKVSDSDWPGAEESSPPKHVYVFQREYATVDPALVQFVGTDEATTCVGIAIRNRDSGMTSIAHMDSPEVVDLGLMQMSALIVDHEADSPLDVYLIGGFDDASHEHVSDDGGSEGQKRPGGYSLPLCSKIIEALQNSHEKFHVQTLCILGHNTSRDSVGNACPIINGFLVETLSGSVMPASFHMGSRCPDEIVRRIRVNVSFEDPSWKGKLLETYDTQHDRFQIAPCIWALDWRYYGFSVLQLSDSEILSKCSTSPSAENPDFVADVRRVYSYLINYPDWRETFSSRKPRVFERISEGGWKMVKV